MAEHMQATPLQMTMDAGDAAAETIDAGDAAAQSRCAAATIDAGDAAAPLPSATRSWRSHRPVPIDLTLLSSIESSYKCRGRSTAIGLGFLGQQSPMQMPNPMMQMMHLGMQMAQRAQASETPITLANPSAVSRKRSFAALCDADLQHLAVREPVPGRDAILAHLTGGEAAGTGALRPAATAATAATAALRPHR
jgi:hypothetical protein